MALPGKSDELSVMSFEVANSKTANGKLFKLFIIFAAL